VTSPISDVAALTPAAAEAIRRLARLSPDSADTPPLSEQALLRLAAGPPVRHLVYQQEAFHQDGDGQDRTLLGYAQLDSSDDQAHTVELVATDPLVATELLEAAGRLVDPSRLRLWAHGRNSVAAQAATQAGWQPVRTLLQMRRTLADLELPEPGLPDGVSIRPFQPGSDDQAWLAVNARAFASHPEQGRWTQADLADRIAAPWFDPAGFLLAVRDGQLLGYHWTKVHTETSEPMGEVYVLGVDPAAQGLKLGKALLGAGLRHLRDRGLGAVLLYVEADNEAARGLYEGIGFTVFARDIQFAAG
jgi:mycothiol synthase